MHDGLSPNILSYSLISTLLKDTTEEFLRNGLPEPDIDMLKDTHGVPTDDKDLSNASSVCSRASVCEVTDGFLEEILHDLVFKIGFRSVDLGLSNFFTSLSGVGNDTPRSESRSWSKSRSVPSSEVQIFILVLFVKVQK